MQLSKRVEQLEARFPPPRQEDCDHPRIHLKGEPLRIGDLYDDGPVIKGYCHRCGWESYLWGLNPDREEEAQAVFIELSSYFYEGTVEEYDECVINALADRLLYVSAWPPHRLLIPKIERENPNFAREGYVY